MSLMGYFLCFLLFFPASKAPATDPYSEFCSCFCWASEQKSMCTRSHCKTFTQKLLNSSWLLLVTYLPTATRLISIDTLLLWTAGDTSQQKKFWGPCDRFDKNHLHYKKVNFELQQRNKQTAESSRSWWKRDHIWKSCSKWNIFKAMLHV